MQITINLTPKQLLQLVDFLAVKKMMDQLSVDDPQDFVSLLVVSEVQKAAENEAKNSLSASGNPR